MLNKRSFNKVFKALGYTYQERSDVPGDADQSLYFINDRFGISSMITHAEKYNEVWMQCYISQSNHFPDEHLAAVNNLFKYAFAKIDDEGDLIFEYDVAATDEATLGTELNRFHSDIRNLTNPLGPMPIYWEDPKCVCYFADDIRGIVFIQIDNIDLPIKNGPTGMAIWTQSGGESADGYAATLKHRHKNIDDATEYLAQYFSIKPSQVMFKTWSDN